MNLLLDEIALAAARLAEAGVESPRADAELIAAHVHGVRRTELHAVPDAAFDARFWEGVGRRAAREPLQHITGRAYFRYLELEVGPGVFVPRPETEVMTGWAIDRLREMDVAEPVVVDLGTGSGAIALSIAQEVPRGRVHAVEADPIARGWTERNVERCAVAAPYTEGRVSLYGADFTAGPSADFSAGPTADFTAGRTSPPASPRCPVPASSVNWMARLISSSATRPTSRSARRCRPRWENTTRRPRCGAARTASTRSAASSAPPGGCCARVGWSRWSTARPRVRPCTGCSARKPAGVTRATTRTWRAGTVSSPRRGRVSEPMDDGIGGK